MQKAMNFVLAMVMVLMVSSGALAQTIYPQGMLTVPGVVYLYSNSITYTYPRIILTNTSNETIQCQIRVYDNDGNDKTALGQIRTGGGTSWPILATGTGDFEIPAHSTRMYWMVETSNQTRFTGYATIEWSSTDTNQRNALIGSIWRSISVSGYFSQDHTLLNNGQPF